MRSSLGPALRSSTWLSRTGFVLVMAAAAVASGHAGAPAVAYLQVPDDVGVVVDRTFTLSWRDADAPIPTGTATVDLFYTQARPPTFAPGVVPENLPGTAIVTGIREQDLDNTFEWDVSNVPSGSYLIWSRVNDPPEEEDAVQIIHFAPGVLTVQHPRDPVHPAVMLTTPRTSFEFADRSYDVEYRAFDPDGTGRVRLEAALLTDEDPVYELVAENLPADPQNTYTWITAAQPEGDWLLRITIEDDRGLSFTNHAPVYLFITHPGGPIDAGFATPDAGIDADADAGQPAVEPPAATVPQPDDGCRCVTPGPLRPWWLLGLLFVFVVRRHPHLRRTRVPFVGHVERDG